MTWNPFVTHGSVRTSTPDRVGVPRGRSFHRYHVYPELSLATYRDVRGASASVYEHRLPFWLPEADSLARWYHVTRDVRTLQIRAHRREGAARLELVFDGDDRDTYPGETLRSGRVDRALLPR